MFSSMVKGGGFVRRLKFTSSSCPDHPARDLLDYFSSAIVAQPDMVAWELHSITAFGLPFIVSRQTKAGLVSLAMPLTALS
jgi:hypothetical protein